MMSVSVSSGDGNGNGSEEFQLEQQQQQQQQQEQKHEDDIYELDNNRSIPSATATATATATSSSEPLLLDHFNPDIVDAMLAKEIDDLPFQERNDIYEEIHGVSNMAMKETPQLIEESLKRLSEELDNIDNNNNNDNDNNDNSHDTSVIESKIYYDYAQSCAAKQQQQQQQEQEQEPTGRNNDFHLRFLRCELFNPKLAAKRICHFYNLLYILYGYKGIEKFVSLTLTTIITSNTNIDINANTDINTKNSSNTKNSNRDLKSGEKKNDNKQTKTTPTTPTPTTTPPTTTTLMDFFFGDNKNDMMLFKSGYIQCLPFRDRSGRKIIVLNLDSIANLKSTIRVSTVTLQ